MFFVPDCISLCRSRTRGPPNACRYNAGGAAEEVQALSSMRGGGMGRNERRAFLSTIKDEGLGMDGQGQTLQVGRVLWCSSLSCIAWDTWPAYFSAH